MKTTWETDQPLQWEGEGNKDEAYLLAHKKSQGPFNTKIGADLLEKSRFVCEFEPWLLVEEASDLLAKWRETQVAWLAT